MSTKSRPRQVRPALSLALGLSLGLCAAPAWANLSQRCAKEMSGSVKVESLQTSYRIDRSLGVQGLTRLRPGKHKSVLGLTMSESRSRINLQAKILSDNWRECAIPQIQVSLQYQPMVVYIAREFAPGTCAEREIMAHEMRHVQANLAHLPKVEKFIKQALLQRYQTAAIYAARGQAMRILQTDLQQYWMPLLEAEMRKVNIAHQEIDSPREYARLEIACDGEIQRVLQNQND